MERRSFLKALALSAVAAMARLPFADQIAAATSKTAKYGSSLYRADGGRVYVSDDGGATWKLHSDLGPSYSISRLAVDRSNRLAATVGFAGWSFGLFLGSDLKRWRTT
jgi:hypothetical protein